MGSDVRVPDEVRKCIVFVGLSVPVLPNGIQDISYIGTAFFVSIPSSIAGISFVYLVTAKHVAERLGNNLFFIRINKKDGQSLTFEAEGAKWFIHPTDGSVDAAILPWAPSLKEFDFKAVPVNVFLTNEIIQKEGIGVGDEVFITGLFAQVSGSNRNLPIVRMGNIAMMPDEIIPTKLGNIEAYLVEARSIGGLSGSPAFVRKTVPIGIGGFYLLGLMHGHWEIPARKKNDLLMDDDLLGKVNMGIAIVVPAKKILEILYHPELVKMRAQYEKDVLPK
jgi:hypothetical protein